MNVHDRAARYLQAVLDSELKDLAEARPGMRNSTLNAVAFRLGGLVAAGVLDEGGAYERLLAGAVVIGLVEEDGEKQCLATITSGLRKGAGTPFVWPGDLADELARSSTAFTPNDWLRVVDFDRETVMRDVSARITSSEDSREAEAIRATLERSGFVKRRVTELHDHFSEKPQRPNYKGPVPELTDIMDRGISGEAMIEFKLGKGEVYGRPAVVIPWYSTRGLWTIQYRHVDGILPKYHWHPGLPAGRLFNGAVLLVADDTAQVLVVEGALNAISLYSAGFKNVVALPQLDGWNAAFAPYFEPFDDVVVALDWKAQTRAAKIARDIPQARFWLGPADPDEFVKLGGIEAFRRSLLDALPYSA
jgi:hypothetical protein